MSRRLFEQGALRKTRITGDRKLQKTGALKKSFMKKRFKENCFKKEASGKTSGIMILKKELKSQGSHF